MVIETFGVIMYGYN